jgi:hypothetical protein
MEPLYYVMNETDGILAAQDPMTRGECDDFMIEFRQRFARQGYYLTSGGQRIPVSEVRFKRIPETEL